MDNIIYIVFFSIFAILLLIVGYIIYDYYNFKDDMEENIDSDMNAVNKFKNNYENYKNVFIKLSGLVRSNQEKTKGLVDETNRTKQIIDDINANQESKLKEIDTLLKTYNTKLREFKNTSQQQKSSYMPFNNEAEILQELKTTEKNLYKHVHNFVLTKKEIYKIFTMFQELDEEHNQAIVGLATETIQINTILLTLLEYNNEVHTMIEHNWDKFDDIRSTIKEPDLTLVGEQLETNTSNVTDLLTKFAQNRHEIEVLKQGLNYTRGILTYIDEEMIDIFQGTQDVLSRMNDLESQTTTFQTRLNTLESEHDTIRNALVQMGIDIDGLENRLLILEQRNTDIGPLLDAIASSIQSNQTNLTSADERQNNLRQTLTSIQETAANTERDIEGIGEDRGNIDISGFDRALKYAFGFKEGGQEISNTLYTNAFSGQSKDLELKKKTNMNSGLTIKTSGQNPLKICADGTDDCVGFSVNENDFSLITHNNVNNFMVKGQQNQMANFDLANNNIFMGGIDDNAIMTIKDGKIVFQNLVLNGKAYCKEEEIPPPVVAPPVIAPPVVAPSKYNFPSEDPNEIISTADSNNIVCYLTNCGDVYISGKPGSSSTNPSTIYEKPIYLFIPEKIKYICGTVQDSTNSYETSFIFISIDGNVYVYGSNGRNRANDHKAQLLGLDDEIIDTPTLLPGITDVVQASSAFTHTALLKKDGTVYVMGISPAIDSTRRNCYNCGGTHSQKLTQVRYNIKASYQNLLENHNQLHQHNESQPALTNIKKVVCGDFSILFLKHNGESYICGSYWTYRSDGGDKYNSQNGPHRIVKIETPYYIDDIDRVSSSIVVHGTTSRFRLYFSNNTIASPYIITDGVKASSITESGLEKVIYDYNFERNTCNGITTTQEPYTQQYTFKLVNGTSYQRYAGIILDDGKVVLWGQNTDNLLGYDEVSLYMESPYNFGKFLHTNIKLNIIQIVGDYYTTAWLTKEGNVYCIGNNTVGQLGINDDVNHNFATPQQTHTIGTSYGEQLSVKQLHCCRKLFIALLTNGDIYAWGGTENIPSGGTSGLKPTRTPIRKVNQMFGSSIAVFYHKNDQDNRRLYVSGYDNYGQLGLGKNEKFGENTPIGPVLTNIIGNQHGFDILKISCSDFMTCFLLTNGEVYTCGSNVDGSLGIGNTPNKPIYSEPTFSLLNDKGEIKDIFTTGESTTYVKTASGEIYSCGNNDDGLLGIGNTDNKNGTIQRVVLPTNVDIVEMGGYGMKNVFMRSSDNKIYHLGTTDSVLSNETHTVPTLIDMQITAPLIYNKAPEWNPPPNNFGTPVVIPLTFTAKTIQSYGSTSYLIELTADYDELLPYYTHPVYPHQYYRSYIVEYSYNSYPESASLPSKLVNFEVHVTILYTSNKTPIYIKHTSFSNESSQEFKQVSENIYTDFSNISSLLKLHPNFKSTIYGRIGSGKAAGGTFSNNHVGTLTEFQGEIDTTIAQHS